jgi:hypothetical protein
MHFFKLLLLVLLFINTNVFASVYASGYYLSEGQCNGENYAKNCSSLNGNDAACRASFTYYSPTQGIQCVSSDSTCKPYSDNGTASCNVNDAIYTVKGNDWMMCGCKTYYNNTSRGLPNARQRCPNDQVNFQGLCYKACTTKYSMKTAGTCTLNDYP